MFLHRLNINLKHRKAVTDVCDPTMMKATLSKMKDQGDVGRILYRVDISNHCPVLLVQTQNTVPIDWGILEKGYASSIESIEYLPKIKNGDTFLFDLRATPTWTPVLPNGDKNKVRMVPPGERDLWLTTGRKGKDSKSKQAGFSVLTCESSTYGQLSGTRHNIAGTMVDFSGVLQVDDNEKFIQALGLGIGRNKGWGCGLLLIRSRADYEDN